MSSAKILVVDDDPDFVEIMRTILEANDYGVITAANGEQALAQVKAQHPDLMLLDIMMSTVLDGLNVSEQLALDAEAKYMPVIMVWLSKPVDPKVLLTKVAELLG
jgi:CheY-like chemotaxis protein